MNELAISLIVYLLCLMIGIVLCFLAQKTGKKIFLLIVIIVLTLVCGFRDKSVGNDTEEYYNTFFSLQQGIIDIPHFEKTFLSINFFLLKFLSIRFVFILYAFFTYLLIFFRLWDYRKKCDLVISFLAFFAEVFFFTLTGLRQSIAFAIVFFGTRYIKKGNYIWYAIFVLIAFLFHQSAIVGVGYLFFEFLEWKRIGKKQRKFLLLILAISPLVVYIGIQYLERYMIYFETKEIKIGVVIFVKIIFLICTMFLYKPNISNIDLNGLLSQKRVYIGTKYETTTIQYYYLFGLLLSSFTYIFPNVGRIGRYFTLFEMVYFGMLARSKTNKKFLCVCVLIILILLIGSVLCTNGEGQFPYKLG